MSHSTFDSDVTTPPLIMSAAPGVGAQLVELVDQFETGLHELPGALHQLDEVALGHLVGSLLRIMGRAENVAALATADALDRGTVAESTATGAPGWVAQYARAVDPTVVHRVGVVGRDCANPRNHTVAESLAAGTASVHAAAIALREVPRVCKQLSGADRDEMMLHYLSLTRFGSRALKELSTRIIGQFAPEQQVRDEEVQQRCESVRWYDLPCGLIRFEADLSGGHAATVKHALQFLSAPVPQLCPDGTPGSDVDEADSIVDEAHSMLETGSAAADHDVRTPGKRRADGLMRLVETAFDVLDGTASRPVGEIGGNAKLVVTLDYNTLVVGLQGTGHLDEAGHPTDPTYLPGIGRTSDGQLLDAGTLRRLACDADLIPMVLGGASEPLDVGRAKRLFTGALRAAIIHRDQGCTFPDCDRPPDWCDAHHVIPWWCGGETTRSNAALLCARHHTIVHRDLLMADVTATGVTWDLTPGLMPKMAGHPSAA
ncbi:DUF222 domain-containing protein [Dermatophilaceae bacterium Sec6.4]